MKISSANISLKLVVVFILSMVTLQACVSNEPDPIEPKEVLDCEPDTVKFASSVGPIITMHCSGKTNGNCHFDGDAGNGTFESNSGINYAAIKSKVDNGSFMRRVLDDKNMPPSYSNGQVTLTAKELCVLEAWIKAGAPNN